MNIEQEYEEKKKEFEQIKIKRDNFKKEETRKQMAELFFDSNFDLQEIDDSYNIYFDEIYSSIHYTFKEQYIMSDDSYNLNLIKNARERYINQLDEELRIATELVKKVKEQFKEITPEVNKNENKSK